LQEATAHSCISKEGREGDAMSKIYTSKKKTVVQRNIVKLRCDVCKATAAPNEGKIHDLTYWREDDLVLTKSYDVCTSCFEDICTSCFEKLSQQMKKK
jgi:hypothetical protein